MRLSTFLRHVNKNSSFLRFRVVFMNYCQQLWGSGVIYKAHETQYIFDTTRNMLTTDAQNLS
jgi:hypothetical protein